MNNWRARAWRPTVVALAEETGLARLATATPYDRRASFVSLDLRAGASPLEVAAWAGHSPAVMFKHYAGVIKELVGEPRLSAEVQIQRAEEAVLKSSAADLDRMVVDLFEHPTLNSPGERTRVGVLLRAALRLDVDSRARTGSAGTAFGQLEAGGTLWPEPP